MAIASLGCPVPDVDTMELTGSNMVQGTRSHITEQDGIQYALQFPSYTKFKQLFS
jgi:hypothetical protein